MTNPRTTTPTADAFRICGYCNGSGEGMHETTICHSCRGSGAHTPETFDDGDRPDIDPWEYL
jgi:DnaJ-class molecular chaperone